MEPAGIARAAGRLRNNRRDILTAYGADGLRARVIAAMMELVDAWKDPRYAVRLTAERTPGEFPFEMTAISLDGLLTSLTEERIQALIDAENVRGEYGPELIGHIVAGNTPLLAWTSILRALLVGSASLVKPPSGPASVWTDYLVSTLADIAPDLTRLIDLVTWKGADKANVDAFAKSVDGIVVYGDDSTIGSVRSAAGTTPVLGYGHRVSGAVVLHGADIALAAKGLAIDILMYDQGGCLSPQSIFVEGDYAATKEFACVLAESLAASPLCGLGAERFTPARTARVRQAREMARFLPDVDIIEGGEYRWTLITQPVSRFQMSPTHGVVYLAPLAVSSLPDVLAPMRGIMQGIAVAGSSTRIPRKLSVQFRKIGVSYLCGPGILQVPPFDWRENDLDILRSLNF